MKNGTRLKRGEGTRIRMSLSTKVPKGWENFLRHADNKTALFHLLATSICDLNVAGKTFFATVEESVIGNPTDADCSTLAPCNHEEADTRLFVHVADAVRNGLDSIMIRTCDTDVLVLSVHCMQQLPNLKELWVHFGTGKNAKFIAAHELTRALGKSLNESCIILNTKPAESWLNIFSLFRRS